MTAIQISAEWRQGPIGSCTSVAQIPTTNQTRKKYKINRMEPLLDAPQ